MDSKEVLVTGWMVQYQDENGIWHDYQWTTDAHEERKMVRFLEQQGNKARTILKGKSKEN